MIQELAEHIQEAVKHAFNIDERVDLTRPESQFGDFATNVALKLAGQLGKKPRDIAEKLAESIRELPEVIETSVAGPGFINIRLRDAALLDLWSLDAPQTYRHQVVVSEYSDPNPFKVLHAGHLYTSVMGDAISNLVAAAGGEVHRVNFGGDVGLHVGKTMWAIGKALDGFSAQKLEVISTEEHANWLAARYVEGTNAYEENETARQEIVALNKKIYQIHSENDHESAIAQVYWTTREWSYAYFDAFYERIGTKFEKYYPESAVSDRGLREVRAQVGEVFSESNGAVVFAGEAFGLHTRVFINGEGLPTYEAKDVGLIFTKYDEYHFDRSIVITGNEQEQYMSVVLKAVEQFAPELARSTTHLTHGLVKLAGGVKMSSRSGNFLRAVDVLDAAREANKEANDTDDERVSLGAVKYAFLKVRMGGDIVYDPQESVSLAGNSGPYLQYAHARACSILAKAGHGPGDETDIVFDPSERALLLKLSEYQEVLVRAVSELMPHYVCTYLYELAQAFNRFYESSRIVDDPRESIRLVLVDRYARTLRSGLALLNIDAPDHL
ncbi:arginine--tRNA ligase [Candidatus Saccharibacteria bacterium]|nr:MAG: arginine--tRNA ligase [Candidatus Saccharibacteria bacterium]